MHFVPRPYQDIIANAGLETRRLNVFASVGVGKTGASYMLFDKLRMLGLAKRALVLGPKRVALSAWPAERSKWIDTFGHLKVAVAIGTPEERMRALLSDCDLMTMNYENIEWLIDACGGRLPFDTVFADESRKLAGHRISLQTSKLGNEFMRGQGSKRAGALAKLAFGGEVTNWFNLTGTPTPNGLQDLWGQMFFIDRGKRLGHSFTAFEQRWFRSIKTQDGVTIGMEPHPWAEQQIKDAIKDVCITIDARDWFPIEEPIERHLLVDLPPKARKAYREMEREMFTDLLEHDVEALNGGGKANKCRQIASGSVFYDKEGQWQHVHDEKLEALRSLVSETMGENLLVAYQFTPERDAILKAFPKARFLDANPQTLVDWNAGKIPMLVCHPASAGHGLSLQDGGRTLVDYSTGWDLELDEQVLGRIGPTRQLQSGYKRSVFRYRIVAKDTIEDRVVIPRLKTKASVQDSLLAAMKRLA